MWIADAAGSMFRVTGAAFKALGTDEVNDKIEPIVCVTSSYSRDVLFKQDSDRTTPSSRCSTWRRTTSEAAIHASRSRSQLSNVCGRSILCVNVRGIALASSRRGVRGFVCARSILGLWRRIIIKIINLLGGWI